MGEKNNNLKEDLLDLYKKRKTAIKTRLNEFRKKTEATDEEIFSELVFCLFTPQSSAKSCDSAVKRLNENNLLLKGTATQIAGKMKGVRFHNTKSRRLVAARDLFSEKSQLKIKKKILSCKDPRELREWLVKNVCGLGYKEASHFLRNIGLGTDLAILDRHILKNLKNYGAIDSIPKTLTKTNYMAIEQKMLNFSKKTGISMEELDLLLWSKETGEIFK